MYAIGFTFNPSPPIAGQSFTITSSVAGDIVTVYTDGSCGGSYSASGSSPLSVPPLHSGSYFFGSIALGGCDGFFVSQASPIVTVTCGAFTLNVGSSTTCTASVSGAAFSPLTGTDYLGNLETVSWSDAGSVSFSSPTCTLSGSACSVTVTGMGAGSASVKGSYSGDSDNNGASGTFNIAVNQTPIPEYPLGLPILAILAVIAYGVIRRRTRSELN